MANTTKRTGPGRPPTPEAEQRTAGIKIMLTPGERKALLSNKRPGESITDMLRRFLKRYWKAKP